MKTKLFRTVKNIDHGPQGVRWPRGVVMETGDGIDVDQNGNVEVRTGHGTSDTLIVPTEIEWLPDSEVKKHVAERAISKLTDEELEVLGL